MENTQERIRGGRIFRKGKGILRENEKRRKRGNGGT